MKKILFAILAIVSVMFFACQKDNSPKTKNQLRFNKTIPGGCAVDSISHNQPEYCSDTVIWNISNDSLSILVGFNDECCKNFKTESAVSNDTIYMNIELIPGPVCNCICCYTYNFLFTGINQPYYYVVALPVGKTLTGYIKP